MPHVDLAFVPGGREDGHGFYAKDVKAATAVEMDRRFVALGDRELEQEDLGLGAGVLNDGTHECATCSSAPCGWCDVHADDKRLVPGFGLTRKLQRHRAEKALVLVRAERCSKSCRIGDALDPEGFWLCGTLFGRGSERISREFVGFQHQLPVLLRVRRLEECNVHVFRNPNE